MLLRSIHPVAPPKAAASDRQRRMLMGGFGAGAKAVSSAGAGLDLWDLDGGAVTARLDEAVTNQQYPNGNVAPNRRAGRDA